MIMMIKYIKRIFKNIFNSHKCQCKDCLNKVRISNDYYLCTKNNYLKIVNENEKCCSEYSK